VREVERRIQSAEKHGSSSLAPVDHPIGIPEDWDEYAKLMLDLQFLAYQADITRVVSVQIAREQSSRSYPWIGVSEAHHSVSHHQNDPEKIGLNRKINASNFGV